MLFKLCPFCHQRVLRPLYGWHRHQHTQELTDGQMRDHITVAPQQRYSGPLDGVPQVYVHRTCGVSTVMPEQCVRSYLANPFLYNDSSFCCGCGTYVPQGQLFWTETGECMLSYMQGLREDYLRVHGQPPPKVRV